MRLLSLVLQNKKGENIIIATSPSIKTRTCIIYSNFIYEYILQTYSTFNIIQGKDQKLNPNLSCVLSINKDYILYIFVQKCDLGIAFDGIKKINEFYNGSAKMFAGVNSQGRLDVISKKFVQFMSVLEEFLYTREITIKQYLPLLPQQVSRKKNADQEIFNKFSHITSDNDKKIILDSHIQSSGIESLEVKRKSKVLDQAKKLAIKNSDDLDILENDPDKDNFTNSYRKSIILFASCGKKKSALQHAISSISVLQAPVFGIEPAIQQMIEEQVLQQTIQRQKIKLKMSEKLQLSLQNAKIKEVLQFGQVVIQGTQKQTAQLLLINSQNLWNNPKLINRRITPVSTGTVTDLGASLKFTTQAGYKTKPILDYIIRKQSFTPDKIPLLFVYTRQVSSSNIEFTFKYKINQKWKHRLYDVDISVYLNKQFLVMDCKSVPSAYSLKNNKITWKTKQIMPFSQNSKGKIILAFGSSNISPKHIIKQIKLSMKANCGLIENLNVECRQDWGGLSEAERMLLIEYKISPNDESKEDQNR